MARGEVTQQDDAEVFARVLGEAASTLEREDIPYAIFGSLVSDLYGRPGPSGDIDVLVRPGDGDSVLGALSGGGFTIERTDPSWIYKAFMDGVLVDVIFRVKGDIYLDDDVLQRSRKVELLGHCVRAVSPEDAVLIEAASNESQAPDHWFNAMGIVAKSDLDWEYLVRRARHATRRILSLLIYCDSTDVPIPTNVIATLFGSAYS